MKNIKNIFSLVMLTIMLILSSSSAVFSAGDDFSDVRLSLINQDPNNVVAGDVVEVRVGVENWGYSVAKNIVIEAKSEFPFEVISDGKITINTIQVTSSDESNMQVVKFKLKVASDTKAGTYDLILNEYSSDNLNIVSETIISIDVKTTNSLEIISIDKNQILPGKKETIAFTLKNVGSSDLNDVVFSWDNTDKVILPVGSDNSVYIKTIAVDEEVVVKFDILSSSSTIADLYNLNLKVEYVDSISSTSTIFNSIAGLYVGGETSFDLVFDEVSDSEYAFTISNIGANDADSVTVKVPIQDGWKINSGSSEIIGNLNKGDYTTVSFELNKVSSSSITLIVDYTNTLGERISTEKIIEVNTENNLVGTDGIVSVKDGTGSRGGIGGMTNGVTTIVIWAKYLGYAILALIISIIGFKFYKKRKN